MPANRLNRVKDVARTLALHPISVYNLIASGDLRATRIGRAVRVSDEEIERFIAARTITESKSQAGLVANAVASDEPCLPQVSPRHRR